MDNMFHIDDSLSFKDKENHIGLRGHIKIEIEDPVTKKRSLWDEGDNIIPISGMQWILMKMFGLHLDSKHDPSSSYEDIGQDTSVVIPDLNSNLPLGLGIGKDPEAATDAGGYTPMVGDITADHFIQGFLVGNGGSGEDSISTKNTNYCFTKLRNPIPFQQTTDSLDPSLAGKYLGVFRYDGDKKYYIKKFDERAHVFHNWWKDGQRWDYIDPITQSDLGPAPSATPKTNRIETYAEVTLSIDTKNGDCIGYFENEGNTQSAVVNELGLVAFDVIPGDRSIAERLYDTHIKKFLNMVFGAPQTTTEAYDTEVIDLAREISTVLSATLKNKGQANIDAFIETIDGVVTSSVGSIDYDTIKEELSSKENIKVAAMYNQSQTYVYETDNYINLLSDEAFSSLTVDEAQRIKLVTYYTFKSIPLQSNLKIIFSYRIYAN